MACGLGLANQKPLSRAMILEAKLERCKNNSEIIPSKGGIESSMSVVLEAVSCSDRSLACLPSSAWSFPENCEVSASYKCPYTAFSPREGSGQLSDTTHSYFTRAELQIEGTSSNSQYSEVQKSAFS